jgi:hypothetical protein
VDEITAYADSDNDQTRDVPAEPGDVAAKTWLPAEPAFLTLTPKVAENPVTDRPEDAHCVQAHVTDAFLNPNPNETVHFIVTDAVPPGGPVEKQGSEVTDEGGIAEFCYTSTEAGLDAIHAFVDSIDPPLGQSGQQDPGEPSDDATKLWQPGDPAFLDLKPETSINEVETRHCVKAEVRDAFGNPTPDEVVRFDVEGASEQDQNPADEDGSDTTDEGGNARIEADGAITRGELEYQDHNPLLPINFHSIEVLVIVCEPIDANGDGQDDGQRASIYGTGEVNGLGPVDFRVRVSDRGEPGSQPLGPDTYQIITAAYTSGPEENLLEGGNIQIHRFS